jgi:hypothetical protein
MASPQRRVASGGLVAHLDTSQLSGPLMRRLSRAAAKYSHNTGGLGNMRGTLLLFEALVGQRYACARVEALLQGVAA